MQGITCLRVNGESSKNDKMLGKSVGNLTSFAACDNLAAKLDAAPGDAATGRLDADDGVDKNDAMDDDTVADDDDADVDDGGGGDVVELVDDGDEAI
jgi:hypothetical protein